MHLNREWLYQKYVVEELSTYDIALIVSRNPKRIYEKLKDFQIPTRPRGHNLSGGDNYMAQPGAESPMKGRNHSEESRQKMSQFATQPRPHLKGANNGMYGRTGILNPRYKSGSSPERQKMYVRSEGKDFLRQTYKRDNYTCQRCKTKKTGHRTLHAHHINSWSEYPELRFDLNNVVTLCRTCHEWVHSRKNVTMEYLSKVEA